MISPSWHGLTTMTETTPLITGVDFVCIPAQDFDAMTAFYGETLGLPFVKRYGSRAGAEYQAGNLTLAIMRTEDFGGTFSRNAMPIALQVADVAALELRGSKAVPSSPPFDRSTNRGPENRDHGRFRPLRGRPRPVGSPHGPRRPNPPSTLFRG